METMTSRLAALLLACGAAFAPVHAARERIELRHVAKRVRAENREARGEVRDNMKEAAQLLLANPDDVEGAKALLARNEEAKRTLQANVLGGISDALKVLTPEQRSMISTRLDALSLAAGVE